MTDSITETEQARPVQAWRVYGIVPADTELPDLSTLEAGAQLGERDLQVFRHGSIAAVVEAIDPARPARRPDLMAHSTVLNALAAEGPVVPIAFGAAFAERDQVVEELLARPEVADPLAGRLEELRGHGQFQIRVRYDMDALLGQIIAADPVIADLRERTRNVPEVQSYNDRVQLGELVSRAVEAQENADADDLLARLGATAKESRVSSTSLSTPSISLAFLVADGNRQQFEAAAEEAAAGIHERAAVELQGPLAPFDFVEDLAPRR